MLLAIVCLALATGGWMAVKDASTGWPAKVMDGLGVIFFGGGGLFFTVTMLYNWVRHIPYMVIYDDRVDVFQVRKQSYHTIPLADVKRFRLITVGSVKMVAVDYKVTAVIHKMNKSSGFKQRMMAFSFNASGAIESFPVYNLTMKGQELCNTLNSRLKAYN